ncbi:MAG: hypothetical protein FWG87_13525 [Defluviitaleaceae bacterium]|nr:hypothetical protein [Defluviitaleaceae bacterium]
MKKKTAIALIGTLTVCLIALSIFVIVVLYHFHKPPSITKEYILTLTPIGTSLDEVDIIRIAHGWSNAEHEAAREAQSRETAVYSDVAKDGIFVTRVTWVFGEDGLLNDVYVYKYIAI